MATLAPAAQARVRVRADNWFYVWMAAAFVAVAFGGFVPTYWAKLAAGSFAGNPIMHIHGLLFSGWALLYLTQTWLVATGRTPAHRSLGLLGIALVSAMACTVLLAVINEIKVADLIGRRDAALQFVVVPLGALPLVLGFFTLAIAWRRRPALHKRLMVLTTIPMMHAAIARWFGVALAPPGAVGPPPLIMAVPPGLVALLFLLPAMLHDRRTLGHVSRVYWLGGGAILLYVALIVPVGSSPGWMQFAAAVERLAG